MQNKVDHAQRRPRVVVLCDDPAELAGTIEILSSQVKEFRTLTSQQDAEEVIATTEPKLLIIAKESVSKSIESYKLLAESGLLNYPHENVLLCENRESGIAFKCCIKGIFSDYFVYKPMYENYRFKMILHNSLRKTEGLSAANKLREEHFGKIDEDLKILIDEAASYHEQAAATLDNARKGLDNHTGVNQVQDQLINELQKTHLSPLIDSLEDQLKRVATELQNRLKDKRFSIAELAALLSEMDNSPNVKTAQEEKTHSESSHLENNSNNKSTAEQPSQGITSSTNSDIKIMVVEDNEFYREMVSRILIGEGYRVVSVDSGLEAIKKLKKQRFSLVLLDLFMPDLDGYNTTRNLRKIPHCKELPIVAISGNKNKEIIRKWATLGLTAYITKPSTKSSLLKAVDKALQQPN